MAWATTRGNGTDPKYRTREHRERRAALVRKINAGEYIECTAVECVMPTRQITNPNGRARDGLHLGHNDDGVTYAGPQHNACNVRDGAKRGRARQGDSGCRSDGPAPKRWLLRDYHACPVCDTAVTWASQRCCSKACATDLRRRTQATKPRPIVEHACALCSVTFTGRKRKYCSDACQLEANARRARDRYRELQGLIVDPAIATRPRARPAF